jgi:hypothetical protein
MRWDASATERTARPTPRVAWTNSSGRWGSRAIRLLGARRLIGSLCLVVAAATAAGAQDTVFVHCFGQRIDNIVVRSSAPTAAFLRRVPLLHDVVGAIHVTTNPEVIERFLLLSRGDACDELRRSDSERILRAQPFIADASVRAISNGQGGITLLVETSDEISLVLAAAVGPGSPFVRVLRIGDGNLDGEGLYLAGDWRDGGAFQDGFGGRLVDNQMFGKPYTFSAQGFQNPFGSDWAVRGFHPFYTDIQRFAWLVQFGSFDDYVQFQNANDINTSHAIRLVRGFFELGGVMRIGPPGRLSLFGLALSGDDERPGGTQVLVTGNGFAPDTGTALLNRYVDHRIARVNLLWGVRDIGFTQVRGLDALSSKEDFPIGFQVGTQFGRSVSALGARDDDIFMSSDLYVGALGRNNALRLQAEGEGRHDNSANVWDGMLLDAIAIEYFKPVANNTTTLTLGFSGGWQQRIPYNFTFSDPIGGLRGFADSNTPGGRRFVARLESHEFLGRPSGLFDLGVGAFAEAGRLWAGDIPYGVNTPTRASVGVSLLGAAPPGSPRTWRLDLAYALNPEIGGHRFEIRASSYDFTTFFLPEPFDVQATREQTVPSSVFRWP